MIMEQNWMQMLEKYRKDINKAYMAQMQGMQPNLAAYHHAIGMLEGYAQACFDAGIATEEEYSMMLQQIDLIKNGGTL